MTKMVMPGEQTARLFERAAEILDEDGWCRYGMTDNKGRHCMIGAVREAVKEEVGYDFDLDGGLTSKIVADEFARVPARQRDAFGIPWMWNDHQRDKRKVQRMLRYMAKQARQG